MNIVQPAMATEMPNKLSNPEKRAKQNKGIMNDVQAREKNKQGGRRGGETIKREGDERRGIVTTVVLLANSSDANEVREQGDHPKHQKGQESHNTCKWRVIVWT